MGGKTSKPSPPSQGKTSKQSTSSVNSRSFIDESNYTKPDLVQRELDSDDSISSNDTETIGSTTGSEQEVVPFKVEKLDARARLKTSQSAPLLKDTSNCRVKTQRITHKGKPENIPPLTPVSKNKHVLGQLETPVMMQQHKRKSKFDEKDGVRLPEHEWREACTDSLRKAIFIQQQLDGTILATRSAPTSVARMETVRATSPQLKREFVSSSRNDRRNSILSSLNCQLDVIPERVEDEKDNPDDYEYSEMNLYF